MGTIYVLADPRNRCLRYVGKTKKTISERLDGRVNSVRFGAPARRTHLWTWLNSLRERGMKPIIEILELVENCRLNEREIYWIARMRALPADLVNTANGGDGGSLNLNKDERKQWIERLSITRKRWWKNADQAAHDHHSLALSSHWKTMSKEQQDDRSIAISTGLNSSERFRDSHLARRGRKFSESHLAAVKAAHKDPTRNKRLSESQKKRYAQMTTEQRKIGPWSLEQRQRMKDAALLRNECRRSDPDYVPPKRAKKRKSRLDI